MTAEVAELTAIEQAWAKHIEVLRPPRTYEPRDYLYASSRRSCRRRMVIEATHPEFFPDFGVDAKARFIRGDQREIDLRQALERVGQLCMPSFTVIGQQERIVVRNLAGKKIISGKIDGKIQWESRAVWPFEVKSWSPFLTDRIFEFTDLLKSPWTRAGGYQLLSYLYSMEQPFGLLILDRPGLPRLIKVGLEENIQLMQDFIDDATACSAHIEAGTLPDFIDDADECRRCPVFGSNCQPSLAYSGAQILTDEEVLAQIEKNAALDEPRKEYAGLHKELAAYLEPRTPKTATKDNKQQIVAGKYLVTAHWGPNTTYPVPEKVKAEYKKVDATGKFNFSVDKVSE